MNANSDVYISIDIHETMSACCTTLCGIQNHIIYVLVWSLKFKDFESRSTMQSSKRALYNTYVHVWKYNRN